MSKNLTFAFIAITASLFTQLFAGGSNLNTRTQNPVQNSRAIAKEYDNKRRASAGQQPQAYAMPITYNETSPQERLDQNPADESQTTDETENNDPFLMPTRTRVNSPYVQRQPMPKPLTARDKFLARKAEEAVMSNKALEKSNKAKIDDFIKKAFDAKEAAYNQELGLDKKSDTGMEYYLGLIALKAKYEKEAEIINAKIQYQALIDKLNKEFPPQKVFAIEASLRPKRSTATEFNTLPLEVQQLKRLEQAVEQLKNPPRNDSSGSIGSTALYSRAFGQDF